MRELAARAGADVLLSNHTDYDGIEAQAARAREARARRAESLCRRRRLACAAYLTVANECAQAALATLP